MLAAEKKNILNELVSGASHDELVWINGFLNGVLSSKSPATEVSAPTKLNQKLIILYGTETGNAKSLATKLATQAKQKGLTIKLVALDQYRHADLAKETYAIIVISTQGDGEPPVGAQKFYDYIHATPLDLKNLQYAVLALGDTGYPLFCKAGEDVDNKLHEHGAKRIATIQKCDVDYEAVAVNWFGETIQRLGTASSSVAPSVSVTTHAHVKRQYTGKVLANINLNDTGSAKETYHIEIAADDISLSYLPGDSLSLVPHNPATLVSGIISIVGANGEQSILYKNEEHSIAQLLLEKVNIAYLPERVVAKYAIIVQQDIPATKIGLLDLLKIYPVSNSAQFEKILAILEPITPRLYSISSAPSAHDGEVHLTVSRDRFYIDNEQKTGLCSNYLSELKVDSEFTFSIHPNKQFRLPEHDKDIIMIGPGTGIAPFRSFLAERDTTGASGKNWLFFGDQHFVSDFLYQSEIQNWYETGVLTKVNVAFSRDQQEKVYVQHKILKNSEEFYSWIEGGAFIYICGAKEPMSIDVEKAIVQVIAKHGDKTIEDAELALQILKDDGRFLKDVY